MRLNWQPVSLANLMLCLLILLLSFLAYRQSRDKLLSHIGIAFGVFGLAQAVIFTGLGQAFADIVIILNTLAYLLVISALHEMAFKR